MRQHHLRSRPGRAARGCLGLGPAPARELSSSIPWAASSPAIPCAISASPAGSSPMCASISAWPRRLPLDEVFIYPSMSDQGLAAGAVLQFLLERDGMERWLAARWPPADTLLRPRLQRRHRRHLRPRPALRPRGGEPGRRRRRAAAAGPHRRHLCEGHGIRAAGAGRALHHGLGTRCRYQPDPQRPPLPQRVHALRAGGDGRGCRDASSTSARSSAAPPAS